jgi:hypothetical protein
MRTLSPLLLAALAGCLLLSGPGTSQAKDDPKDNKKAEKDDYILFRVAGRKWLLKRTPKPGQEGGDDGITYHQFEVKNAYPERADVAQTSLDASRSPGDGNEFVMKLEFKPDNPLFTDPIGFKKGKVEKLKTDAGTFECQVWFSLGREDGDAYIWRSTDFPGLVVKQDDRFGTREISKC